MRAALAILVLSFGCASHPAPSIVGARPVGAATQVPLPGPCVDAQADAATRLAEVTAQLGDAPAEVTPALDVDGDGAADRMFSAGAGVTTNTLVYVIRGGCGHFVGDVAQPPVIAPGATRRHGLVDLHVADSTACEGARCGCDVGDLVFQFDGTSYHVDEVTSRHGVERTCPGT
ncbi:MAG: hypothetical protein NT062_20640 [Proteobacteria bacterium]|nr:hypothetical protein [Pseudomonadota bacterium]